MILAAAVERYTKIIIQNLQNIVQTIIDIAQNMKKAIQQPCRAMQISDLQTNYCCVEMAFYFKEILLQQNLQYFGKMQSRFAI